MICPMPPSVQVLFFAALSLLAQDQSKQAVTPSASKNLKVLTTDVNIGQVMQRFTVGLGVQCSYCHAPGDFASDENPKKEIARKMLLLIKQINRNFPDAGNDFLNSRYLPFPEGKQYVTCYTCHQGETKPKFQNPEPVKRAPEPYAPGAQGVGIPGAPPPPPGVAGSQQ
jgi:hypothetical protein